MSKRILAAMFAAMIGATALSGCGGDNKTSSDDSGKDSTPSSSSASTPVGEDYVPTFPIVEEPVTFTAATSLTSSGDDSGKSSTPSSSSSVPVDENYVATFPIVEEPVTFTAATSFENMPKTIWNEAYAKVTNVNIEWNYWSDWETQLGIAMAGDSLPDFVFALSLAGIDKAGIEQYGKAGALVEYGQYLGMMPNVSSLFEQYPESRIACANEDGTLYGLPGYLETLTAYPGTVYYRDRAKPGVFCCQNVHIGIPDEQRILPVSFQFFQQRPNRIRGRLFGNPIALPPDCSENAAPKKAFGDFSNKFIRLVGKDCHFYPFSPQGAEQFRNAGIGAGLVHAVRLISRVEYCFAFEDFFRCPFPGGKGAFDELLNAVSDKMPVTVKGMGREAVLAQCPIRCISQIFQ